MKKYASALALAAVIAAPAAQAADISITGYVAAGIAMYNYGGEAPDTAESNLKIDDGRYSRFRLSAVEDIGNGLKADLMIEQRFLLDNAGASGVANGNAWVGLSGGFGKVMLGRIDTYYSDGVLVELSRATSFASFGTLSLLTQVAGAYAVTPSRHNNQIRYTSPNMNGFSATLAYSSNSAGADGNEYAGGSAASEGDTIYGAASYFKGPIYAGASFINQENDGTATEVNGLRVYGSYTLPFGLKIGLSVDQTSIDAGGSETDRTAWILPLTYKTGPHAIYGNVGMAGETDTDSSGATFYSLGYDYALSNRTSVGVNYSAISNDDNGTYSLFLGGALDALGGHGGATAGLEVSQIYAGVSHAF